MKKIERNKAIFLRNQGLSYNDILEKLPVSKGSLSCWLRDVKLSASHQEDIKARILNNRVKFLEYNRIRSDRIKAEKQVLYNGSRDEIRGISEQELKLIGVGLYWAEGYKANSWKTVSFTNSDPGMIALMMRWFREICKVKEERFRLKLQIHDEKAVKRVESFWSEVTQLPLSQFTKATVKISKSSKLIRGNILPYGTLQIRVSDIKLFTRIRGWIKGLEALSSSLV